MSSPFDLTGRAALVTGASSGIGEAIAIALANAGADIVAVSRRDPAAARAAVESAGRKLWHVAADLAGTTAIADAVAQATRHAPHLDILVNNAGTIRRADALEVTEADWDAVVDVNLKSAFFLAQAFARTLVARNARGKVINVASLLSFQGGIRVAAYTASKSGLLGITRLLANEWAKLGINVNAIAPGYVATANTEALRADATRNRAIVERIPAGRWGEPGDLGGAAVFLASGASDYVHGAVLPVDGGWLAR
ncbi:MAG TPA: 2-dehydro-3-deoxy-D-gluconate 5-dehydrogenase KduD [Xanthomonadales bacterium]|nr:2-dehydro-3-deoxy-D-gluconate 5-dehydrogenase KduD [Xanthomonadales bacterium]